MLWCGGSRRGGMGGTLDATSGPHGGRWGSDLENHKSRVGVSCLEKVVSRPGVHKESSSSIPTGITAEGAGREREMGGLGHLKH